MSKELLIFVDNGIDKCNFHHSKYRIDINNMDIDKILISNKVYFGKEGCKYFSGYKDDDKVKPLCKTLSKIIGYAKIIDEVKYISLLIKGEQLLKNTNKSEIKIAIILKRNLIGNKFTMINT